MKNALLLFIAVFISAAAVGQRVSLRKDTIYSNGMPCALFRQTAERHVQYLIYSLNGKPVINIHYSHVDKDGKQGYVVTFLNDYKQGMIYRKTGYMPSIIKELV